LEKIKKNHLLRALRCDKISLALLSASLRQYIYPDSVTENNLTLKLFARNLKNLREMSKKVLSLIDSKHHSYLKIIEAEGRAGSGAYPVHPIPSLSLQIKSPNISAEKLSQKLRQNHISIFGYIENDSLNINFLTIFEDDLPQISKTLNKIL